MGAPLPMEYQDKVLKCVDCGTDFVFTAGEQLVFPRQAVQERTQTLQELQGQASGGAWRYDPRTVARAFVREDGDPDELFAVRERNYGAVPSDARTAGAVPRVFSAGTAGRERLIILSPGKRSSRKRVGSAETNVNGTLVAGSPASGCSFCGSLRFLVLRAGSACRRGG